MVHTAYCPQSMVVLVLGEEHIAQESVVRTSSTADSTIHTAWMDSEIKTFSIQLIAVVCVKRGRWRKGKVK